MTNKNITKPKTRKTVTNRLNEITKNNNNQ